MLNSDNISNREEGPAEILIPKILKIGTALIIITILIVIFKLS